GEFVWEEVKSFWVHPHDGDAGNVQIDVVRHGLAVHFGTELRILKNQVFRDHAGLDDFAAAINVFDKGIDRLHSLLEAAVQDLPFLCGKNARDNVERDQPFLGFGIAMDRKGDADATEYDF